MVIVLVVDVFDQLTNGTTMTAYRFAQMLKKRGHEVRVLATSQGRDNPYKVGEKYWPIATRIAHKQGFSFAKADTKQIRKAMEGADVAHFLLPLRLERKALKIAREMGVPCSAAFHLQPENITYIIHMSERKQLAKKIYRLFDRIFYHEFSHIHCPSRFIAQQLQENGYRAKTYVISNGIDDDFVPPGETNGPSGDGLFRILMVGRLSPEKRQRILIEAVRLSKYSDRIQLYLAGKGPEKDRLIHQGENLAHPPVFGFYSKEDLIRLIHACDLYVHASVIEIEAISCMEAFACGLVPVICNSTQSATPQFALDEKSLFEPDNAQDLADKIDYWIEHPDEKEEYSKKYARQGDIYRIDHSIEKAEEMFRDVIRDDQEKRRRTIQ